MTAVKEKDREVEHERMGVFSATTIFLVAFVTTPAACVSCTGQAASRAFDKGECNVAWQERIRPEARRVSGLWLKNPRVDSMVMITVKDGTWKLID